MSIPDPAAAVDWYWIGAGAVTIVGVLIKIGRKVEKVNTALASIEKREFGGNSGGMRQAVNEIQKYTGEMAISMARLEGRFDQHIEEHQR